MSATNNKRTLEEGFALAKALIKAHLEANLIQLSVKLVHEAIDTRKRSEERRVGKEC